MMMNRETPYIIRYITKYKKTRYCQHSVNYNGSRESLSLQNQINNIIDII